MKKILFLILALSIFAFADSPTDSLSNSNSQSVQVTAPVAPLEMDSTNYYTRRMTHYEHKATIFGIIGNCLFYPGVAILGVGVYYFMTGNNDEQWEGVAFAALSAYLLVPGITLKAVSGKQRRNAKRFEQKLNNYKSRKSQSDAINVSLSISPTFNLENHATGAMLSLRF